jgi:hypothetical protein
MKKILFFLFLSFATCIQAQTYDENQELISRETIRLKQRLTEVKDIIYYLDVYLDQKIAELVAKTNPTSSQKEELEKLQKEKYFATKGDLEKLQEEKRSLEGSLRNLNETSLSATAYHTQVNVTSEIPKQMSAYEYQRYTRAQAYRISEEIFRGTCGVDTINTKRYPGLVINDKRGLGETVNFYITRTDISNVPTVSLCLNPGEKKTWSLPAGTYQAVVVYGSFSESFIFHVDPRVLNWFDEQNVYWAMRQRL